MESLLDNDMMDAGKNRKERDDRDNGIFYIAHAPHDDVDLPKYFPAVSPPKILSSEHVILSSMHTSNTHNIMSSIFTYLNKNPLYFIMIPINCTLFSVIQVYMYAYT